MYDVLHDEPLPQHLYDLIGRLPKVHRAARQGSPNGSHRSGCERLRYGSNRRLTIDGCPVPTMISNLFRLLFTATLALGAVAAVIGHAVHGWSDAKMVRTVQKVDHPKIMGSDHPKR